MVPKTSYPPTHHHPHLTTPLTPSAAQAQLAAFLSKTQSKPYLHPDALLSTSGITYSAQSGPTGGLAIHHLKRIEAGLRGENLIAETADELAQFGEEAELAVGDDSKVDALIEGKTLGSGRKGGLKRKRTPEEVAQWAEQSSEAAFGNEAQAGAGAEEWQDQEDFEQQQQPLVGEVGGREGAPVTSQNGAPPTVAHVEDETSKKPLTDADRRARKDAKKAKKKERAAKGQERRAMG